MPTKLDTEAQWRAFLNGEGHVNRFWSRLRHFTALIPSDPRCKVCNRPFGGFGRLVGNRPSKKNPQFCDGCAKLCDPDKLGGAEVELSLLFVDVRGSTALAEHMSAAEFSRLMNRFYATTTGVLVKRDALIDKLVGDEVIGLFVPGYAGLEHARAAVQAAQMLLRVTGHGEPGGTWLPIGVGVHTGTAFVGMVAGVEGTVADFTALGDPVNVTARLASKAGAGEALISHAAYTAAGLNLGDLEQRQLELKGKSEPVSVWVLRLAGEF